MNPSQSASSPALSRAVAWLIGLIPVVMVLTTWDDKLSVVQALSRYFFVPVLLAEVAVILFTIRRGLDFGIDKAPGPILACLFALLAIAWSGAIGSGSSYSVIQTSTWMIHLLFGLSIAAIAAQDDRFGERLVTAMLTGFLLFAFLFVLYAVIRQDPDRNWTNDIPAFGHIRWFGFYGDAIFGLCAWGWLRGRKGYALIAILALGLPLWTGSRAPLAAVIGGYLVACVFFPFVRGSWRRFAAIVALAVLFSIAMNWLVPLGLHGPQRLINNMGDTGRLKLWADTLTMIAQSPWFGWGEGSFVEAGYRGIRHPHNVVLQILLAWGVVGALLVAALTGWLARRIYAAADERDAPLLFAALILAAASLVDGVLYLNQSIALFAMCVAVLAARRASDAAARASLSVPARAPAAFAGAAS